jgi:hypothetical protein
MIIIDNHALVWYNVGAIKINLRKQAIIYMENNNKDKVIRSSLDEPIKQAIMQTWNIDVDSEILSPLVDYIFKRLFTADEPNSKAALIDFINSVLVYENDDIIVDLTIVSAQIPVDRGAQKKSIFDIRAKYDNGRQIVIEMQKEATPGFRKRSQHIVSRTYGSQEISGEDYDKLEKCYVICITNFNVIRETTDYIKDYRFRDRQGNDLTDDETIVFLDLSKIEDVLTKPVEEMTNVEKWLVFFKYVGDGSKRDIRAGGGHTNGNEYITGSEQGRGSPGAVRKRTAIPA